MQILEALKILAETKDKQIAYLEDLGTSPVTDELALQFTDTYQVFKGNLEDNVSNAICKEKILNNLERINFIFEKMSNLSDKSFWDISSLDNIEWNNVRRLAEGTVLLILDTEV